jgi:hypothetical protein
MVPTQAIDIAHTLGEKGGAAARKTCSAGREARRRRHLPTCMRCLWSRTAAAVPLVAMSLNPQTVITAHLGRAKDEPASRNATSGSHQDVRDSAHLVNRRATNLSYGLGNIVNAVDVCLTQ